MPQMSSMDWVMLFFFFFFVYMMFLVNFYFIIKKNFLNFNYMQIFLINNFFLNKWY